jgi:hypothetical protein
MNARYSRITIAKDIKHIIEREERELTLSLKAALSSQDDSVQYILTAQELLRVNLFENHFP